MYKLLQTYKNLENHNISGKISLIERLETRSILLVFYPSATEIVYNNLKIENQYNYFPLKQQHFVLKNFLFEEFLDFKENTSEKYKTDFSLINKDFVVFLKNSQTNLFENRWIPYLNKLLLQHHFKIYKKFFSRIEKKFFYKFLMKAKMFYWDKNIRKYIYKFFLGNITLIKPFLKKFWVKCFKLIFLKNKLQLFFKLFKSNSKFFFEIQGFSKKNIYIKFPFPFFYKNLIFKINYQSFLKKKKPNFIKTPIWFLIKQNLLKNNFYKKKKYFQFYITYIEKNSKKTLKNIFYIKGLLK